MIALISHQRVPGLSLSQTLVVIAIIAILVALLTPFGFQGVADGEFRLALEFQGNSPPDTGLRVAVGYGQEPNRYFEADSESRLVWYDPADWDGSLPPIRCSYSFGLKPDWLGRVDLSGPDLFYRLLFVEYYAPNKPSRYRVITFERHRGQEFVQLTVPRDPPNDADAWKPDL